VSKKEFHKRVLCQAVDHFIDNFVGDVRGPAFKEQLVDEILRVNDRFNSNPDFDEALNSGDGSYRP